MLPTMFEPSSLRLNSIKKYVSSDGIVSTRVKSAQETVSQIAPICNKIGVTRISDITCLDRLYIPNYSTTLPGTDDSIWVYGGKGPTMIQARASALMESIERYCSLSSNYSGGYIQGTYKRLSKIYNTVLHA
jgi:ribosomal protein S12 methylthiotransferase accessory factor YcaO